MIMPITNRQFEKGLDETRNKVIEFLENNSGNAYLYNEIAEEVGIPLKGPKKIYYEMMFGSMVWEGLIEKKALKLHSYYRAAKQN
jgi:hypothetical protein